MILGYPIKVLGEKKYTSRQIDDVLQQVKKYGNYEGKLRSSFITNTSDTDTANSMKKKILEENSPDLRRKLAEMILDGLGNSERKENPKSLSEAYIDGIIDSLDELINSVCLCILGEADSTNLYNSTDDTLFIDKLFLCLKDYSGREFSKKAQLTTEMNYERTNDKSFGLFWEL